MTTETNVTPGEVLGERLRVAGFCCRGVMGAERLVHLAAQVVKLVGMSTAGMTPKVWAYPLPGGEGGVGETICQPLVESLLTFDTWPVLDDPRVYVILASCRAFDMQMVAEFLNWEIGDVVRQGYFEL